MSKRFWADKQQVTIDRQVSLNGKFDVPKFTFPEDDKKATLLFTTTAYLKMYGLVDAFDTEVQWHGTVKRLSDTGFLIDDIVTFPHTATSATVDTDEEKYTEWLMSLDDALRCSLRLHGHSHVNMGITPSSVDDRYRINVLKGYGIPQEYEDLFQVFLIANKRRELNIQIFDISNNSLYDYKDNEIDVDVITETGTLLSDFVSETKKIVTVPALVKHSKPEKQPRTYYPRSEDYQSPKSFYDDDWLKDFTPLEGGTYR